jgi:hypothetical protein
MGKKWEKPNLIVLYRGRPEEVLRTQAACKSPIFAAGPGGLNNKCDAVTFRRGTPLCSACREQPRGS